MAVFLDRVYRNFSNRIEEPVRKHLRNVYACLTMSAVSAAIGVYASTYTRIFGAGLLTTLAALGLLCVLQCTPPNGKSDTSRLGYLFGFAFFTGTSMEPLLNFAIEINPEIIISALIGTVLIFSCFTISVLFAPREYWLFLGGPISTILSALFFLSLANIFFETKLLFEVNIYLGLFAMCGFVIYDTTLIMEKCRMNDKDFISHTISLFLDFIGIFQRLVVILLKKENKKDSRSKNN